MDSESDVQREYELFSRCLDYPEGEWERVLVAHCDDNALRLRVRQLLERHRDTHGADPGFLRLDIKDPECIGPYRILQRLGEGGMGIVYAAQQREPVRRRVAIKVLRAGHTSREVLTRFDVERQALALMSHPNIARIFDAGTTTDDLPFIVMEFVPGEPITRFCERHDLPLEQRLVLFCQVCDAVQHAHQKGVIHRDLKPSNILVTEETGVPMPKVIDFGIAKAIAQPLTEHTLETKAGSLLGTPDYMSPEQAEFSPDVDTRADVYALGAVLYHMLTGVPPLDLASKTYTDMQRGIREQNPLPPSSRVGGSLQRRMRGELDWITMKALEKQRGHRYSTPAEFAADIASHLANRTVIAGPPSRWRNLAKFLHRHWLAAASMAAVVVTLAVSQVLVLRTNRELELQRDRANTEAAISVRVTDFLLDIFKASDPANPDAGKITARELLDRGRQRIENDTTLSPEQRQRLLVGLGDAYGHLGLHENAIELLQQALAVTDTGDPLQRLRLLGRLGQTLQFTRRATEARDVLQQALGLAEDNGLVDLENLFDVRRALTAVESELGSAEESRRQLKELLAETRQHFGAGDERTLDIGARLIYQLSSLAEYERAETLTLELLPVARRALGEEHPITSYLQGNLANVYMALDRWEEAEKLHRQVYERFLRQFGPQGHPTQLATTGVAIATADREEGLSLLHELAERQREQYGSDAPQLILTIQNIGWVYSRIPGREVEARDHYDRAFALALRHFGEKHAALPSIHYGIAALEARAGNSAEALAHFRKASGVPAMQFRAAHDPDFAALRRNPEFNALLGRFVPLTP